VLGCGGTDKRSFLCWGGERMVLVGVVLNVSCLYACEKKEAL